MTPFVAPAIRRPLISIAFCDLATAAPYRFVCRSWITRGLHDTTDALDLRTLIVVRNEAAAVVILDLDVVFVAPNAMELLGRSEIGKECGKSRKKRLGGAGYAREDV